MTKNFDMVKDIDGQRETWKLVIRIIDLGFVENRNSNKHMEIILTYKKGNINYQCMTYMDF